MFVVLIDASQVKKIISLFAVVARTRTHSELLAGIPPNLDPFPYM
jgi:hypothetical protein